MGKVRYLLYTNLMQFSDILAEYELGPSSEKAPQRNNNPSKRDVILLIENYTL